MRDEIMAAIAELGTKVDRLESKVDDHHRELKRELDSNTRRLVAMLMKLTEELRAA